MFGKIKRHRLRLWLILGIFFLSAAPIIPQGAPQSCIDSVLFERLCHAAAQDDDGQRAFYEQGLRPQFAADLLRFPDVPQYTYVLSLEPDFEQTVLSGTGSITFTNTTPDLLGEIVLRMYPNLNSFGGDAVLENVRVNGVPVVPSLDETRSVAGLPLSQSLAPGEALTIEFDYQTVVHHGVEGLYNLYSYLETELTLPSSLPLLSVYEPGSGWWRGAAHTQGDAVYSTAGNFDVTITTPDYLKLITSGTLVDETAADGLITQQFAAPLMRDFAIMASAKYETISGAYEDITIDVHYLPGNEAGAQRVLAWGLSTIQALTTTFGAYVYPELDIVETYTSAGGIEYPGLVVVASDIWQPTSRWFEKVTVHEVAHQWWYGMVGNDQTRFPWLDEALTEYSVAVYERAVRGEAGYQDIVGDWQSEYSTFESAAGVGVIGEPAIAYNEQAYSPLVYRKGGYFFHTLSQVLGLDVFNQAMRVYLETYRYAIATPFDLQTVLEQVSGVELDEWFVRWVGYTN